jgi:hypothetical protein
MGNKRYQDNVLKDMLLLKMTQNFAVLLKKEKQAVTVILVKQILVAQNIHLVVLNLVQKKKNNVHMYWLNNINVLNQKLKWKWTLQPNQKDVQ